jgi:hypothetical protein
VVPGAVAGRGQGRGAEGGAGRVPCGQRILGIGVVAVETGPQAHHEGDVEAVHPDGWLVTAGVDVAVPAPPGGEDEISWFHRDPVAVDDHARPAAGEPEPQGRHGMGVDRCGLAGEEHLVGGRQGGGGANSWRGEPGVAQDQRAALECSRLVHDFPGSCQFRKDVVRGPDVAALRPDRVGDVRELPERQRGQLRQPLVIVRNVGWGEGLGHRSSPWRSCAGEERMRIPAHANICQTGYIASVQVIRIGRLGHRKM